MTFDEILEQNRPDQDNYDNAVAMSQRFQQATKSPDWNDNPYFNMEDAAKTSRNPVNRVFNENDLKNITSDVGTIAWDSFRKGVMDLQSVGDKAEMALGNTLAGISGNTIGTEMRDRAADSLMKTMEESRFIDSNYGDAETWTARFVGGGMSMGEMLAVGAATGMAGLGAYVGTLSLSDGALNDMVKYQEEHGSLDGYETDPVNLALDYGNAVFQVASELVSGTGRLVNGKVFKAGSTGNAILKETVLNFLQESAQGAAADLTEVLKGNQDISILADNAVGYMKDGVVAGVLGGAIGGSSYKLNKNRALQNLDKINAAINPTATQEEIRQKSEEVFEKTEQKMLDSFVPELIAQNEAVNDRGSIRDNVQKKITAMYDEVEDMSEQEKAKTIEASTTLELENMLYDSVERQIPLSANPLLQGEVNELGWFREGIPENRRAEIESLRREYVSLRDDLKAQNEATEKNYDKIEELENKLQLFRQELPNKLQELIVADREEIRKMLAEQRERVAESQAKKRMIAGIQKKAQTAIKAQEKAESKLAEQMARGAEKAQLQREKKETAQQTKEAKIRDLQEQRDIARAIKNVKLNAIQKKRITKPEEVMEQPTVMLQESFDLADENARLDDIYPEYTGETIEVDGKERTVYNSNGDRIANSKEALTNFWKWFGDSKVVDEQGRPLVVYHGTEAEFDTFETLPRMERIFTAKDRFFADMYGRNVMPMYSKIVKPLVVDFEGQNAFTPIKIGEYQSEGIEDIANYAKEQGFDGVIATNVKDYGYRTGNKQLTTDEYIPFDPKQLKSVNNRGTYSSDTGNIYFQTTQGLESQEVESGTNEIEQTAKISQDMALRKESNEAWVDFANYINHNFDNLHPIKNGQGLAAFMREIDSNTKYPQMAVVIVDDAIYGSKLGLIEGYFDADKNALVLPVSSSIYNNTEKLKEYLTSNYIKTIFRHEFTHNQDVARGLPPIPVSEKDSEYYNNPAEFNAYSQQAMQDIADSLNKLGSFLSDEALKDWNSFLKYSMQVLTDARDGVNKALLNFNERNKRRFLSRLYQTYVGYKGNKDGLFLQPQQQGKVTGGKDTYRGAYLPEYRFIAKTANMDASTLNHELAHDWGQEYFRWARSGKASESFLRSWGAVEKAIGITDKDTYFTYDASEKFARAYEGWLLQKKDWAKILKIDNDDDKKAVESMMEDYRQELVDIYESLLESSKYFERTYGEVGELKPELVEFFERASRYDDIDLRAKRGEITEEQANDEKLNHLVETAVNGQVENMPVEQAQEADAIVEIQDLQQTANDTEKFETEGGNVKALQKRLDNIALAQDLTQNDKDLGRYDSHRDMLAVAEQADEFVKNRREDALAIINGEMAEQDGLYASDLYTALERVANSTGDFDLIQELRNSKIANEMAKELGQRIAGFRNYKGSGDVDVVSVLNSLDKKLKDSYNQNKEKANEYVGDLVAELKIADNNAQLDAFFDEMECK